MSDPKDLILMTLGGMFVLAGLVVIVSAVYERWKKRIVDKEMSRQGESRRRLIGQGMWGDRTKW
ncbi:MAG TPA: hypothetical protein VHB93_00430 [Candidatus Paceibacterota bacterium]|nr:hypothetical protein [Candidatus Paceibacterota bacterium]